MSNEYYHNYEDAINTMRQYTSAGIPFSLTFMKLSGSIARVEKAILRSMSGTGINAKYRLQYTNTSTNEYRSLYLPLLMAVNDKKIRLKR
ncbi:hypothetical protein [Aquimarina megaterium]|uniref:hypothetical protein n=1 Tax=Aquimarina megaterium TaxID=1443666 RepID=UPI000945CF3C|nr:hypothetical protein [Aquimarina megaterium]